MPLTNDTRTDSKKKDTQRRDLADPKLRDKHAKDSAWGYGKAGEDSRNRLIYYGVKPTDVVQGQIADCYLVAALAAVASARPALIEQGLKDQGDGTYAVRFFEKRDWWANDYNEVWVTVDGDLPAKYGGAKPRYARGQDTRAGGYELWPGIVEKAYAEWKGGYDKMGEGGSSVEALEALTGGQVRYSSTEHSSKDLLWRKLERAAKQGAAMSAGTFGKDRDALYEGKRLYAWHAYTVLGVKTRGRGKKKERVVILRNPWGQVEPGDDGKDDGVFELTLDDFMKFYQGVNIAYLD
jgi:hypothetical protein